MNPLSDEEKQTILKTIMVHGVYEVLTYLSEVAGHEAGVLASRDASLAKRWDGLSNSLLMLAQRSVNL